MYKTPGKAGKRSIADINKEFNANTESMKKNSSSSPEKGARGLIVYKVMTEVAEEKRVGKKVLEGGTPKKAVEVLICFGKTT